MKKSINLIIKELFLVKADWTRTFMGTIFREKIEDGSEIIRGTVVVNEGKIWCAAETEEKLGEYLDDICVLKLDGKLHDDIGVFKMISDKPFFLN